MSSEEIIRSVIRVCRGPLPLDIRKRVNNLLWEGKLEAARELDHSNRLGCGYDFNDTIVSGPLDGKEHDYECPMCGVKGTYRAPLFEISK
jgi:hypothetical protein